MTPLELVLAVGAVARLTRLVVADQITAGARGRIQRRFDVEHGIGYLVGCPWCVSIWVGAPTVATAAVWGSETWWQAGAALLLASHMTGLAAEWETR